MNVKILYLSGIIQEIKISSILWTKIHNHRITHFFKKEFKIFLDKYNLSPTYFNLNCLDEFRGVILTNEQIQNLKLNTLIIEKGVKKNDN